MFWVTIGKYSIPSFLMHLNKPIFLSSKLSKGQEYIDGEPPLTSRPAAEFPCSKVFIVQHRITRPQALLRVRFYQATAVPGEGYVRHTLSRWMSPLCVKRKTWAGVPGPSISSPSLLTASVFVVFARLSHGMPGRS